MPEVIDKSTEAPPSTKPEATPQPQPEVKSDKPGPAPATQDHGQQGRPAPKQSVLKRPIVRILLVVIVLGAVAFGIYYLVVGRKYESTDDAFIDTDITEISPQVAGHIIKVNVTDNQEVKAGDVLAEIDPQDFQVRLNQAEAQLAAAEARQQSAAINVKLTTTNSTAGVGQAVANVALAKAGVSTATEGVVSNRDKAEQAAHAVRTAQDNAKQAQAQVVAAEAEANRANDDVKRYQQLFDRNEVSRQRLDQAIAAANTANANVEAARQRVSAAQAQVGEAVAAEKAATANIGQATSQVREAEARVGDANSRLAAAKSAPQQIAESQSQVVSAGADIEQARTQVEQAKLNLSYTKILAPIDGRVTRKSVAVGNYVQTGQVLVAVVPHTVHVTANFKETQVTNMRPGEPVQIHVDAYPGITFPGHVDSIQSGTGSRFSALPPENATGNYVKVVQRIPVKIVFDGAVDPNHPLAPGMSVTPEVKVK